MSELARVVIVAGPTAVGKTALALELAERLGGEVVNADSVQLYRGLDIGSAKPSLQERQRVPHHLIDVLDPDEDNNVADFAEMARRTIQEIHSRGRQAIVVGGTGLYLRVLVHGILDTPPPSDVIRARHQELLEQHGSPHLHAMLAQVDPELAGRLHPNDFVRISRGLEVFEQTGRRLSQLQREHDFAQPRYDALKLALVRPRQELYQRIDARAAQMFEQGFLDEVRGLLASGVPTSANAMQALGYRQVVAHLTAGAPLEQTIEEVQKQTRRYAKRQISWLRSEEGVRWARATALLDAQGAVRSAALQAVEAFVTTGHREAIEAITFDDDRAALDDGP